MVFLSESFSIYGGRGKHSSTGYERKVPEYTEFLQEKQPRQEKQYHESLILILDIIKSTCYNFEAEKNKVLEEILNHKKAMKWRQSEWSTIAEYNYQFIN